MIVPGTIRNESSLRDPRSENSGYASSLRLRTKLFTDEKNSEGYRIIADRSRYLLFYRASVFCPGKIISEYFSFKRCGAAGWAFQARAGFKYPNPLAI